MQPPSINSAVSPLPFFFAVTLDRSDLARRLSVVREPRRLPALLSVEVVALLLQAAWGAKHKAALATAYGAGLRASPRWSRSRSATPTLSACSCESSAARTATPCCRRSCLSCCAPGGGGPAPGGIAAARLAFPGQPDLEAYWRSGLLGAKSECGTCAGKTNSLDPGLSICLTIAET
jgi:hypothetical protein